MKQLCLSAGLSGSEHAHFRTITRASFHIDTGATTQSIDQSVNKTSMAPSIFKTRRPTF